MFKSIYPVRMVVDFPDTIEYKGVKYYKGQEGTCLTTGMPSAGYFGRSTTPHGPAPHIWVRCDGHITED